jgi:hypothetical protein
MLDFFLFIQQSFCTFLGIYQQLHMMANILIILNIFSNVCNVKCLIN